MVYSLVRHQNHAPIDLAFSINIASMQSMRSLRVLGHVCKRDVKAMGLCILCGRILWYTLRQDNKVSRNHACGRFITKEVRSGWMRFLGFGVIL